MIANRNAQTRATLPAKCAARRGQQPAHNAITDGVRLTGCRPRLSGARYGPKSHTGGAHEETRTYARKDRAIWPVPNCQPGITNVSQSNCLSISQHRSASASKGPPPTRHISNCDYWALHLGRSRVVRRRGVRCCGGRVMCGPARVAGAKDCRFSHGFRAVCRCSYVCLRDRGLSLFSGRGGPGGQDDFGLLGGQSCGVLD